MHTARTPHAHLGARHGQLGMRMSESDMSMLAIGGHEKRMCLAAIGEMTTPTAGITCH